MSGVTLRGAVRLKTGVAEFGFSRDDEGNGVLSWASVPAGRWSYDVFMDDGNEESPLLYGCFVSAGRVTPDLPDEQQAVAGAVVVQLPEGSGCVQVMLDNASSAAWYAEQAKKYAENFNLSVGQVTTGEPGTPANAEAVNGSEVGSYLLNFTIPRGDVGPQGEKGDPGDVNTEESYTWSQPQAFSSAINANGGVNIPLAVGAPTNESGVNRLYAAGMGGAANAYAAGAFLNTDSLSTTGTATVTKTVPWQMARIGIPAGAHTTIQAPFEGPSSQWNYSSWAGFSFVWRATTAAKLTMGIGRGAKTIRTDLTTDSYTIIPGNDLAFNSGEILDITFDNVRDTARNGYTVRVREIYALNSTDGWQVKTTTSFIPATQNEPVPWTVCKIIYQQQAVANSSVYENLGGLWLMVTGAQTNNLYKIATCRGVSNFETGVGVSRWVTDVINITSGTASVYAGPGEYAYYQPGNINPLFYGLDAIGTNAVESEETAAFEDINVPIEES